MSNTNTGGPAFPHDREAVHLERTGMTLRDYFAAKAMQALLARDVDEAFITDYHARNAYKMADAMLKARKA